MEEHQSKADFSHHIFEDFYHRKMKQVTDAVHQLLKVREDTNKMKSFTLKSPE